MKNIKILKITFLMLLLPLLVNGQKAEIHIKTTKLSDNFYMLEGSGGNIGIFVGDDGVFMIDSQYAPLTPKILNAIKKITPKSVSYLLNTHWHGDHTGGNENMNAVGAKIISHENVRKRMSSIQNIRGREIKPSSKKALPNVTFTDDITFHLNGDTIFVTHIHNAHTDGDVLVYLMNNNIIHAGDAYFQGKFPFIDVTSGGSIDGYINGIKKIILLSDNNTIIIAGHGTKTSNKETLKEYLKMLMTLKNRVQLEIDKGKKLESVKNNITITKEFTSYNGWITEEKIRIAIYKSLIKK